MNRIRAAVTAFKNPELISSQDQTIRFPVIEMDSDNPWNKMLIQLYFKDTPTVAEVWRRQKGTEPEIV